MTAVLGEALSHLPEQNVEAQVAKERRCTSSRKDGARGTSRGGSLRPDAARSMQVELHSSATVQALSLGPGQGDTFSKGATQVSKN